MSRRTPRAALAAALLLVSLGSWAAAPDLNTARAAAQQRDFAAALSVYAALLVQSPQDVELLIEVARVQGFADHNREAAALYRRALVIAPQRRAELLPSLAWQTLWGGDAAAALPLFDALADDPAQRADALDGRGQARLALDQPGTAAIDFRQALALNPDNTPLQRRLARALLWADQPDAAAAVLQALLQRQPTNRDAAWALAITHNLGGRHRLALREFAALASPSGDAQRADVARAWNWAGYADRAAPLLAGQTDPEVVWLRDFRVGREGRHLAYGGIEHAVDSDSLESLTTTVGGGLRLRSGATLDLRLRRLSLADANGSPTGEDLQALYSWRLGDATDPGGSWWPALALRALRLGGSTVLGGLARVTWIPQDLWRVDAEWSRDRINTPKAVADGVHADALSLGADHQLTPRLGVTAAITGIRFDDGNRRLRLYGRAEYLLLPRPRWAAGVEATWFNASRPTGPAVADRGYWNPARYQEARVYLSWRWERRPWDASARVGLGVSNETDGFGNRSTGHPNQWAIEFGHDFSPALRGTLSAAGSGSSLGLGSGGIGYWRRSLGMNLIAWF